MPLTLFLSAPADPRPYGRAVMPARAYRAFQHLFGFDAQLRAFADCVQQAGQRCYIVPAPEIFSTGLSFERLLEPLGAQVAETHRFLHVRFGMVRHQRLLKGLANVAVVAENAWRFPVNLGRHPFACGDVLPAGCLRALRYEAPLAPLRAPDGRDIPPRKLAAECAAGDLLRAAESLADAQADHDAAWHDEALAPAALQVQSLHEFDPAGWSSDADSRSHALSTDFRRVLINKKLGAAAQRGTQLVMLPWNLAHGGSTLPALVERLARFSERGAAGITPVLFPYNVTYGVLDPLAQEVARLREACAATPILPSDIFVARLTQPRDAHALAALFPLAWIDADDPEYAFVMRRLAQIGIACAVIAPAGQPLQAGLAAACVVPATESLTITVDDSFGPRLYRAALPTVHALAGLVRQTMDLAPPPDAPPPTPPPPLAKRDTALLQSFFAALEQDVATGAAAIRAAAIQPAAVPAGAAR